MRVVLDPNILVSSLLSPAGAPARLLARWLAGDFELIVSGQLLAELERAMAYPKLRARIESDEAARFLDLLRHSAEDVQDPPDPAPRSPDPGDDYLIALAAAASAALVSGDAHVLGLAASIPVYTAQACLHWLDTNL